MTQTPRVLVSYARDDGEDLAAALTARIERENIPVWRDRDGLRGGEGWWRQIEDVLDVVEFLVVVMTPGAVQSPIVRREWDFARRKGVCVFPVVGSKALAWSEMPGWMSRGHFYDLEFQETKFLNDLNTRCEKVRVPFMAEELPDNFVPRPELYERLMSMLIDEERSRPKAITTALRGAGGFGKTTLARALCHDIRTRYVFDDGVLWVTLGEQPVNAGEKLHDLIYALTRERPAFSDPSAASARLRELLEQKSVLIVIDDVWREADAKPFLVGGAQCAWLLTTRNRDTLPPDAEEITVDEMREEEASQLLGADLTVSLGAERAALAALAARLGEWPLLLNLANRVLRDRVRRRSQPLLDAIADASRRLNTQGLVAFDRRDAAAREQAVAKTIGVSVELLRQLFPHADPVARFEELAVFPEDVEIPVAAVERLWGPGVDARDLCDHLFNLSLLLTYDLRRETITLHDVVRTYLLQRAGAEGEKELHRKLLEAYRASCGGQWHTLADDGYILQQLVSHLLHAGLRGEVHALIDRQWRNAKRERFDTDRSFATDVGISTYVAMVDGDTFHQLRGCYVYAMLATQATRVPSGALAAMARIGDDRAARDHAELIRDPIQRSEAFRMIGEALSARDDEEGARRAFTDAFAAADRIDRAEPASEAFSALALASAALDRVFAADAARRALEAARQSFGYVRPAELLGAAEALCAAGLPEDAAAAAEEAIAGRNAPDTNDRDEVRWLTFFLQAAHVLERIGAAQRAAAIRARAQTRFDNLDAAVANQSRFVGSVGALLERLTGAGEHERAVRIVETWPYTRSWQRAQIHAVLAEHRAARGETEEAAKHVRRLLAHLEKSPMVTSDRDDDTPVSDLNRYMRLLIGSGQTAKALEVAWRIRHAGKRADAFAAVALAAAPTSPADTRRAIEGALEAAATASPLTAAQVRFMAAVLRVMNEKGKKDRVERILSDFDRAAKPKDAHYEPEWNDAVIDFAAARSFDPKAATSLLQSVGQWHAGRAALQQMRIALQEGRREEAVAIVRELGDAYDLSVGVATGILALAKEGARQEAEALAAELLLDEETEPVRLDHAQAVALTGRPDRAVELILALPEESQRRKTDALLGVAALCDSEAASGIIEVAERAARDADRDADKAVTLARVAEAWRRAGNSERADTIAEEALEVAREAMKNWKVVNRW